jgi:hypothetical protein
MKDVHTLDPKNVNGRLYDCISILLDNFQEMTVSEQVRTVAAIARIQVLFIKLREDGGVATNTGTTVKKYAKAFEANAARRRKRVAGAGAALAAIENVGGDDELEY